MFRKYIFILLLLIPASSWAFGNPRLNMLLDSGEYFRFREEFRIGLMQDSVHPPECDLYYAAWHEHLFGNPVASNEAIRLLTGKFAEVCPDSIEARMLLLHLQNDFRLFRYSSVDSVITVLRGKYTSWLGPQESADLNNFAAIVRNLLEVPAQSLERHGELNIAYKRDIASLIRIPVTMGGETEEFIFDTGANLSTISESQAKKMKLRIFDSGFGVASSSHANVESKLGLAEELRIGNAVFRNVIFIVLPDKSLRFAAGIYKIRGIIGIPVIAQLGEVQITKDGKLISPEKESTTGLRNFGMNGNTPFVDISFYGKSHPYIFDTGAAGTIFNKRFLQHYSDSLTDQKSRTSKVGGAGGVTEVKIISCTALPYSFGGKTGKLKKGTIQPVSPSEVYESFFGIAGEDIFMEWETMTINFTTGFISVQ